MKQKSATITFEPIKGHQYSEFIVSLSTQLYTQVNCGFRSIVKILEIIDEAFNHIFTKIPCHNTIENWIKKCGLDIYNTSGDRLKGSKYAEVVDESMMIGSEKLLLTLGVPAEHKGKPLSFNDVEILDIAIAESWSGEGIAKRLKESANKVGHNPDYVISDNASIMNKGVRCSSFKHQRDISHSLGMFMKQIYEKDLEFIDYCQLMTAPKFQHNMKKIAYLLPPKQRTIARFINMNDWVIWSMKILEKYTYLSEEEKRVFSFIPENASLIEELFEVQKCIKAIEKTCKNDGFSVDTARQCKQKIKKSLFRGNERMMSLGGLLHNFLTQEVKIITRDAVHNNSSDVIESIFGKYKARKSPNKLNGITSFVLFIPLQTALSKTKNKKQYNFKMAMENVRIKDIELWGNKNLTPNLNQLRINKLKNIA